MMKKMTKPNGTGTFHRKPVHFWLFDFSALAECNHLILRLAVYEKHHKHKL